MTRRSLWAMPSADDAALRAQVELPLPLTITVDAVTAVDTTDDVVRWSDVRAWTL